MSELNKLPTVISRPADVPETVVVISDDVLMHIDDLLKTAAMNDVISDEDDHQDANDVFASLHQMIKALDEGRKEVTSPIEAFKKSIINMVKPFTEQLSAEKDRLGKMINKYDKEQERIRIEAQRKIDEEERIAREKFEEEQRAAIEKAKEEQDFPDLPSEPQPSAPVTQVVKAAPKSKIKVKKIWKLTIDDKFGIPWMMIDETGVKHTLLIPDEVAIRKACKAGVEVPGCTWKQEESIGA